LVDGISDKRSVTRFISVMAKAKTIEDKIILVGVLNRTGSQEILESFSNQKGCRMLA